VCFLPLALALFLAKSVALFSHDCVNQLVPFL